jgi:hypothetical protein
MKTRYHVHRNKLNNPPRWLLVYPNYNEQYLKLNIYKNTLGVEISNYVKSFHITLFKATLYPILAP